MKKISKALIFILLTILCSSGCSDIEDNPVQDNDFYSATSVPSEIYASKERDYFDFFNEFHDHLISYMANSVTGVTPLNITATQESDEDTGNYYYYVPSWVPEGFALGLLNYGDWSVGIDYKHIRFTDINYDTIEEDLLNNSFIFEWITQDNAEAILYNWIERANLILADSVMGLYYRDSAATSNPNIDLMRSYYWIQDEYMFHLSIPLWTINGEDGNIDEHTANQLIMNSAMRVDLVADVFFEPPVSVELDETEAELDIGETIVLTAEVTPSNATIDAVFWNSSDNRTATVDQDGLVTRVGPGAATITATTVANGLTATFELPGTPIDYEVTEISANEILHTDSKDIEVTVTFRNNLPVEGYVPVELLYSTVVYLTEDIYFDGTPGQMITKTYLIENLFLVDRCQIMARINHAHKHAEENSENNSMPMSPKYVPVPHFDYAIIFMRVYRIVDTLYVNTAFQNRSYEATTLPVQILYENDVFYEGDVTFNGIPYEVVTVSVTGPIGEPFPGKIVEASINWAIRQIEENPDNNRMVWYIDID